MNEKVGFEIILKMCEDVTFVTVRTISMITITMIPSQNWVSKYLLHYSLFLKFSQTWYISCITKCTKHGIIYKSIGKLKRKKEQKI